jgi:hypothetical protein
MRWTGWRRPRSLRWPPGVAESLQAEGGGAAAAEPGALGLQPGFVLLRNGQCCEDKIYLELGLAAEAAAWWQHNNASDGDRITVGAITELRIPIDQLRSLCPGRSIPGRPRFSHPGWADPGAAWAPLAQAAGEDRTQDAPGVGQIGQHHVGPGGGQLGRGEASGGHAD